eukprot:CAMPEP_0194306864 /NCGR_PEP_ID=MMETSP0171-20130528/3842_1 /TAXON_ID=218684 /ORGANISM="Corethron pennatum, Strain L29A3" /LENGTH=59 /DNA_ID=CAMNT_0039058719 /DNA_START=355 /DNA_END=534 /DNA_ORIENTATION=-
MWNDDARPLCPNVCVHHAWTERTGSPSKRQRKGGSEKRPAVSLLGSDVLRSPETSSRVK